MPELYSTSQNPLVHPGLNVWGWEIPVYLFLGGLVAGLMIIAGHLLLRPGRRASVSFQLPLLGLVLLSAGMLALFLDLEHKPFAWRLYVTFRPTSPMSWGAWILVLVYPALVLAALFRPPAFAVRAVPRLAEVARRLEASAAIRKAAGSACMVLGVGLGVYTGILLSTLGARPLWNSALLAPLFLVSGLSSGAALGHMLARDREEGEKLACADNAFLVGELALLGLFLLGLASAGQAPAGAAGLLLYGPFSAVFWALVVGVGIVVPLVIQSLAVSHRIAHTPIGPALVLGGGLALRFVIVYAGQYSHWPQI